MTEPATELLFLTLQDRLSLFGEGARIGFERAVFHPSLLSLSKSHKLTCIQYFKPDFDALTNFGVSTSDELSPPYDLMLYLGSRVRDENLYNFARALSSLRDGGELLASFPNSLGAARFEKSLASLAGSVESKTKFKCRAFWATKDARLNTELLSEWLSLGKPLQVPDTQLLSLPGLFGRNVIDVGSRLLASHMPTDLKGRGADLGAGWGYLSFEALSKSPNIRALDLYEADSRALKLAKHNLKPFSKPALSFFWQDVTKGLSAPGYDWIVMNPPFHRGEHTDHSLGIRFVEIASAALRPGGELHMVSNAHLPYQFVVGENFSTSSIVAEEGGFRVVRCIR